MVKSINAKFLRPLLLLICLALFCCLNGCGNGATTGTGTTTSASLTLSISSSVVTFGTPVTATATLTDANGAVVQGAIVTFAATSDIITFTPTSATALTDASGVASIVLNAASVDSTGATSITASAPVTTSGTTTTVTSAPVGIAVNGASVTLGALTLGSPSISSYGTSSVSIPVFIDGASATVPISVTFTSSCVSAGKATLSSPVTTISGTATSTYKDNNCASGTDLITASVTGASASAIITVATPATSNIQFVSATPSIIGTSTTSAASLPTSSVVKFKVVDSSNNGKSGVLVDFTILPASAPGGITLSATQATSDSNGEVTTTLSSGTVPTPIWVVATVHGTSLKSQSNTLTITTGLPTQDFFSLSVEKPNIEGWGYNFKTSKLSIIASDRLGEPVPDGTVINFITEGCQITPAYCTTISGTCYVTFTSADSRPANGRVTVLASALGEKSFVDTTGNGNNVYVSGDTFYDLGDPYIDANENGLWDTGETFISMGGSGNCYTQPGNLPLTGEYGTLGNIPSVAGTCSGVWGTAYVRRSAVMVLSGSTASLSPTSGSMASSCTKTFPLRLYDLHNNPMPANTAVTTATNNVIYTANGATTATAATVNVVYGNPVPLSASVGGTPIGLQVNADCSAGIPVAYPAGTVDIIVTTPENNVTLITFTVN